MLRYFWLVCVFPLALVVLTVPCLAQPSPAQGVGLTLQALSAADLDTIQAKSGYRVGVLITAVAPGSPAATAGLQVNNVLFLVAGKPVASPADVDQALAGQTGEIRVGGLRANAKGEGEVFECRLVVPAGGTPAAPPAPTAGPVSADVQAKLQALDAARAAGVLSEAEYQQKRAALLASAPGVVARTPGALIDYADPQGRFYLRYPPGWTPQARADGNGVDLVKGGTTGSVLAFAGQGTAEQLVNAFLEPISQQSREFKELRHGEATLGNARGPFVEYTGISPNGQRSHSTLSAIAGGGMGFLFMLIAPESDFAMVQGDWGTVQKQFSRERPTTPPAGGAVGGAISGTPGGAALPKPSGDPFTAYFDMLDFMRSQAWGKPCQTAASDRQRLLTLLQQADAQTKQNVSQGLQGVPQAWAELQKKWAAAAEPARAQQREFWRKQLLLPTFVYPPPLELDTFKGRNDRVVFEHPRGWVVAQAEDEGTQYLYLGPPGTQTTWEQVLNPAQSPPGALFVIMPLPAELKNVSYIEGARLVARQYVATQGADFTELSAEKLGDGAILALRGTYPGSNEQRFFWVGLVKYGPDQVLAGRLGGPVALADQLVPAFSHMVMTMELNPPGGDGGYGSAMVDYYTSRLGNIAVSSGW